MCGPRLEAVAIITKDRGFSKAFADVRRSSHSAKRLLICPETLREDNPLRENTTHIVDGQEAMELLCVRPALQPIPPRRQQPVLPEDLEQVLPEKAGSEVTEADHSTATATALPSIDPTKLKEGTYIGLCTSWVCGKGEITVEFDQFWNKLSFTCPTTFNGSNLHRSLVENPGTARRKVAIACPQYVLFDWRKSKRQGRTFADKIREPAMVVPKSQRK